MMPDHVIKTHSYGEVVALFCALDYWHGIILRGSWSGADRSMPVSKGTLHRIPKPQRKELVLRYKP